MEEVNTFDFTELSKVVEQMLLMNTNYVKFWNENGGIISKWTNHGELTPTEKITFANYLKKCCDIFKEGVNDTPTDDQIDTYITYLLNKGIDPL